ncbi:MAG: thiol reductant ABC exporter subunit CydD [Spirochaetia bacterium]
MAVGVAPFLCPPPRECTFVLGMMSASGWLRQKGRPARGRLALTVCLGEAAGILLVLQTALLARIADAVIFRHAAVGTLAPLFLAGLLLIGLRAAAAWATKRAAFATASGVKQTLRSACVAHLRRIGPVALAGLRAGELAHAAVDAVEALDAYYSRYLPQRAIASLLPFTILAAVFPLDWISGLVLLLTAVFLPLSMIVIGDESHERNQRLWGRLALMSGRFLDVLQGLATVRMFDAARREAREIERASAEYRTLTLSVLRIAFLSSFMLELISALSIAIVAVLSGLRMLSGHMAFRPGYFILLIAPEYFLTLRMLGTFYHSRMEALSAAGQIRELLAKPAAEQGSAAPGRPAIIGPPSVTIRGLSFSYAAKPVLEGMTLTIAKGEHIALTGASGAGKTTLLLLLMGFARAREGAIEIDSHSLADLDPGEWRRRVAWLPQRPTLFHGTVRDNITLGRPDAQHAEIQRAIHLAHVDEFLPRLPSGIDTPLGEEGEGLSSGQAQRVALCRLFLRDPCLVLLDEPTAHLDAHSAALVTEGIRVLAHGRTTILVTHKPEAALSMDKVLVLREGKVEEQS